MDISEFDKRIEHLEQQAEMLRRDMETTCRVFLNVTKEFAIEWFQTCVEKALIAQAEKTRAYGIEKLRELKGDLRELLTRTPSMVEDHLNRDEYWAHRGSIPEDPDSQHWHRRVSGRRPADLDGAIRGLFGYVGAILIKHQFAHTGEDTEWEEQPGVQEPRYRYGYDWPEPMTEAITQYGNHYGTLLRIAGELRDIKRQRIEAEAKDLWNRA
jgi:hypothetical protein